MTPEKRVQNSIIDYLRHRVNSGDKIFYDRRQAGSFSYKMGIPDIYVVYKGIHLEIEVKKPGGELSTMQEKFEHMCQRCSIPYVCASSVDDVKSALELIDDMTNN